MLSLMDLFLFLNLFVHYTNATLNEVSLNGVEYVPKFKPLICEADVVNFRLRVSVANVQIISRSKLLIPIP